jgi:hypothetical protein
MTRDAERGTILPVDDVDIREFVPIRRRGTI